MEDTDILIDSLVSGNDEAVLKALTSASPDVVTAIKTAATKVDKQNLDNKKQDAFNSLESVFNTLRTEVENAVVESFTDEKDLKVELVVALKDGQVSSIVKARKKGVKHPLIVNENGVATMEQFADFARNKRAAK